MPDTDQYAAEQAARLRDDWQFSRIFTDASARPGFTALLALRSELQHVLGQAAEPGIVAMKFEWWRTEIERGFAGDAQHPLARALGEHLGKAGIATEYCLELVDAAEMEAGLDAFTQQEFRLYLYRSGGVLAEQLALLSGASDRSALDAARRIGQLKRFTDMLLTLGAMLRADRWLFPEAWLRDNGLDAASLPRESAQRESLAQLMSGMLDDERVATRTAMEAVTLPPSLLLQWSLAQRDHARLRKNPGILFMQPPARDNAFARLWTAWRSARKAAAHHMR